MDKGYQLPYSYNGTLTRSVEDPAEIKRLKGENKHLAKEIEWFLKRQEPLSQKLKQLEDKVEKLKNDPDYKVNLTVLKKCLIVRKCRNASAEVKKALSLVGALNDLSKGGRAGAKGSNATDDEAQDTKFEFNSEDEDHLMQSENNEGGDKDAWMRNNDDTGSNSVDDKSRVKIRKITAMKDRQATKRRNTERKKSGEATRKNMLKLDLSKAKMRAKVKKELSTSTSSPKPVSNDGELVDDQVDRLNTDDSENGQTDEEISARLTSKKKGKGTSSSTQQSEYICDQCGKVFTGHRARGKLTSHVRYHNTPRPMVECKICGKKVKGKYKLVQHIKDHSREKQFKCTICDKEFLYKYNLLRHMLLHSGEKPYQCHICHRTFRQKNQAEQHMDRIHVKKRIPRIQDSQNKFFMCLDCNVSFLYFNCLIHHFKADHVTTDLEGGSQGEGEVILFNSIAQRHMLHYMKELPLIKGFANLPIEKQLSHFDHPNHADGCCVGDKKFQKHFGFKCRKNYLCTICGQVYAHQGALQVHMRIHSNERPYQCMVCLKRFRQRPHLATHTRHHMGIKRHKCPLCGKDYSQKPDLIKHLEKIHNRNQNQNQNSTNAPYPANTSMANDNDCDLIPQTKPLQFHHQHDEQQQQQHQLQQLHQHILPLDQAVSITASSTFLPPPPSSSSSATLSSSSLHKHDHYASPSTLVDLHGKPLEQIDASTQRVVLTKAQNDHHHHPNPHHHNHHHSSGNLIPGNGINVVTVVNLQCAANTTTIDGNANNGAAITTTLNTPVVVVQQQQEQQPQGLTVPLQQRQGLALQQQPPQPQPTIMVQPPKSNENFHPMSDFLSEEYNNSQQRYHTVVVPGYSPE